MQKINRYAQPKAALEIIGGAAIVDNPMDIVQFYKELQNEANAVFSETCNDVSTLSAMTTAHNYITDFELLEKAIHSRPESEVIRAAIKEYQFALYALSVGLYRHSFVGLRLFFELFLASIQFSAHEIDYRMWANGEKDINWSSIISSESGVFAVNFIRAFNAPLKNNGKQFLGIAETVYRECSEYVHGNSDTHETLPAEFAFSKKVLLAWSQKAQSIRLAAIFAFSARHLSFLSPETKQLVEPILTEAIGHLPAIQAAFALPENQHV